MNLQQRLPGVPWGCRCGWLKRAAADPEVPVCYDTQENRYVIQRTTAEWQGIVILNYCPSCGDASPAVTRNNDVDDVLAREMDRLRDMVRESHAIGQVIAKFGEPDRKSILRIVRGDRAKIFNTAVFSRWSSLVEVHLIDYGEGRRFGVDFAILDPDPLLDGDG